MPSAAYVAVGLTGINGNPTEARVRKPSARRDKNNYRGRSPGDQWWISIQRVRYEKGRLVRRNRKQPEDARSDSPRLPFGCRKFSAVTGGLRAASAIYRPDWDFRRHKEDLTNFFKSHTSDWQLPKGDFRQYGHGDGLRFLKFGAWR
ncbi:hypothetical protein GGX14DRAFT_399492 [Mycena pura]|uniref:Uncharacterized protein n=1 Tax=Mycena pura TaxID=153505 RepID=A0AAD6Y6R4_9AGAR|nr:hypothetical protein GGX14DRAFT_399492 [Mycena pura]